MTIDTSFLPLRPKFVYGATGAKITWTGKLPCRAWDHQMSAVGGQKIAAAGIPGAYTVRRDYILLLPMRLYETEWANLVALTIWGQRGESFLWYPDSLESTSYEVWLHSPVAGEDLKPSRSRDYPKALEVTLGLRSVDAAIWALDYYGQL